MGFLSDEYDKRKLKIGDSIVYPNGRYTVIDQIDDKFMIKFDTGTIAGPYTEHEIRVYHVYDPYEIRILGVASIGKVPEELLHFTYKPYRTWYDMIDRCYNPNNSRYNSYGGSGVYVCDRWKCLEYFLEDLPNIPGYKYWLIAGPREYHLDKDIKQEGVINKVYSLETCVFVPAFINEDELRARRNYKRTMCKIVER